ncbi:Obg family GTPase CgtA, partial [Oenococcus oeni]
YHFTTIDPNLGMVQLPDGRDFTIADLPGLIKGASKGVGLGFEFLRHVERTRVLLHMIDMSEESGLGIKPFEAYLQINQELKSYDPRLLDRPMIIVATKMDLPSSKVNLEDFKQELANHQINMSIVEISSVTQTGTKQLLLKVADLLDKTPRMIERKEEQSTDDRLYEFKDDHQSTDFQIEHEGDDWIIVSERISKLAKMTNKTTDESLRRFARQLRSFGVDDKLREAGAKDGDMVYIDDADFAFEFEE